MEILSVKARDVDAIDIHPQKAIVRLDHRTYDRAGETLISREMGRYEAACWLVWIERARGNTQHKNPEGCEHQVSDLDWSVHDAGNLNQGSIRTAAVRDEWQS